MYGLICQYCKQPFERNRKTYQYCCRRCAYDDRIGKRRHPNSGKKRTKKPIKFICKNCGNPFGRLVYPSDVGKRTLEFCSPSCRNKARKLKKIPCPICGTKFKPKIVDTGGKRKQFCSPDCEWKARIDAPFLKATQQEVIEAVKEIYPQYGPEPLIERFGIRLGVIKQIIRREGLTLNEDIYYERVHKSAQEYMTGENNPNWQGGITCQVWGDDWETQRKKALKRDNYQCQVCFESGNSVHHIIPRREFGDNTKDMNDLSNLITLCDKHHIPVEMGKVPCPKPRAA